LRRGLESDGCPCLWSYPGPSKRAVGKDGRYRAKWEGRKNGWVGVDVWCMTNGKDKIWGRESRTRGREQKARVAKLLESADHVG